MNGENEGAVELNITKEIVGQVIEAYVLANPDNARFFLHEIGKAAAKVVGDKDCYYTAKVYASREGGDSIHFNVTHLKPRPKTDRLAFDFLR